MITKIKMEGMHCSKCANLVQSALEKIDGVEQVEVSLEENVSKIKSNKKLDEKQLKEIIENLEFQDTSIES